MTKSKKVVYFNPSSAVKVNGQDKAGINITNTGTSAYYNMDADEKKAYDYASEQFALNLPKVNVFDADTQKRLDSQVQSYIDNGVDDINDIYIPIINELQNDVAARFGNFDNSIFLDNLSEIEDSRANAISDFSQDVQTYRQELTEDEIAKRFEYLDYLNNYRQQVLSNMLNMLGASQNLSDLSNSYYSNLNNIYAQQQDYNPLDNLSDIVGAAGNAARLGLML